MIIDDKNLTPEQRREVGKEVNLNEVTMPRVSKYALLAKYFAEAKKRQAIQRARDNIGGRDGK